MQHFQFTRCQRFKRFARGKAVGHFGGYPALAGGHGAQGRDKLFAGGIFQNITLRAGGNGLVNILVAIKRCRHQDAGGGVLVP